MTRGELRLIRTLSTSHLNGKKYTHTHVDWLGIILHRKKGVLLISMVLFHGDLNVLPDTVFRCRTELVWIFIKGEQHLFFL